MIQKLSVLSLVIFLAACSSNPHKISKVEESLENEKKIGDQGYVVGKNDQSEFVVQKKVQIADYLKNLEKDVYALEHEIYGSRDGNKGQRGVLEDCLVKANSLKLGGDGGYVQPPEKAILTESEGTLSRISLDDKEQVIGVSEEYLLDRVKKFEAYKKNYSTQREWYDRENRICELSVEKKKFYQINPPNWQVK